MRKLGRILRRVLREERGMTLVLVAGSMVTVLAVTALAVDIGMLTAARTEAQRTADAAALAGAGALISFPGNEDVARAEAIEYAAKNRVRKDVQTVLPEDVDVDLAQARVTVRVIRNRERGTAVRTFFAAIMGINDANVFADATAEASVANSISCPLPLTIPDRWEEEGGDPDAYDEGIDNYTPWNPDAPDAPYTGYTESDVGLQIALRPAGGGGGIVNPSWYYPWRPPNQSGADDYRENIANCVDPEIEYHIGIEVVTEPGAMTGPTQQGVEDLVAKDPGATWNEVLDCVTDGVNSLSDDASACRGSPRIRPIPLYDPTQPPADGAQTFRLSNFAGVFVEGVQGNLVMARFMGYGAVTGGSGGAGPTGGAGPLFKKLILVE